MQDYKWLSVIPCRLMKADGTIYRLSDGKINCPIIFQCKLRAKVTIIDTEMPKMVLK